MTISKDHWRWGTKMRMCEDQFSESQWRWTKICDDERRSVKISKDHWRPWRCLPAGSSSRRSLQQTPAASVSCEHLCGVCRLSRWRWGRFPQRCPRQPAWTHLRRTGEVRCCSSRSSGGSTTSLWSPTCHVLKGERCGGIAPGVTLLVSNPSLVQVLHEAILMRTGEKQHLVPGTQEYLNICLICNHCKLQLRACLIAQTGP